MQREPSKKNRSNLRLRLEYLPVWLLVHLLGLLPREAARAVAMAMGRVLYLLTGKLRGVGLRNLQIAFPGMPLKQRRRIVRGVFTGLGRQLAEFCQFPHYTRSDISQTVIYDGFENFEQARQCGKGVLFLTGHFGGWEIGSFVHSLHGNPLYIVARKLDNPYIENLVRRYRTLHGNVIFDKDDYARGLLSAVRKGETVGILMDTNMTPPQGVFAPYFGVQACTAVGLARLAMHTGAAVVPAFTIWDKGLKKYRVRFDPVLALVDSGDTEQDAVANTALFNQVYERYAREYPDQWLWVHRRWKTRPQGEKGLY